MELEDFKDAWSQYDKKLSENLKLNEELLKKMNLNSSKRELQKPLIHEITGVVLIFLLVAYVVASSIRFIEEPKYCIPGFFSALLGMVYLIFAIIKTNRFLNINYYGASILKLQKDISSLNKLTLKIRKFELALSPFLILSLLPVLFKAIDNIDLYNNVKLFSIEVILILGISFPLVNWINKHLYDKRFKNAEKLLEDLKKFEEEK